jgi:hypothetical protein
MPAVVEAVHTEVMRAQRDDMALLAITASSSGPASG